MAQVYDQSDSVSPERSIPNYAFDEETIAESEIERPLTPVTESIRGYIESVRGYIEQQPVQSSSSALQMEQRREDSMESTVWEVYCTNPRRAACYIPALVHTDMPAGGCSLWL